MQSNRSSEELSFDVVILGAGGAGMMCAARSMPQGRGRRVALLDHSSKVGGKILISGGGRCNFTNLGATPNQYVSKNPHFAKSALSRFVPTDFVAMVEAHGIAYHESKLDSSFATARLRRSSTCFSRNVSKREPSSFSIVRLKEFDKFRVWTKRTPLEG